MQPSGCSVGRDRDPTVLRGYIESGMGASGSSWKMPTRLPSVSVKNAIHPTPGIGIRSDRRFPPAASIEASDSSTSSTEM